MYYVINLKHRMVEHESRSEDECKTFVRNAQALFNVGPFIVVKGAAERIKALNTNSVWLVR